MKNIERRINSRAEVKLEKRAEGEAGVIAGVGAVVYDGTANTEYELWDYSFERAVERIMPGAFAKAIQRPDDVRGLFNHDSNQVLGRTKSGTMTLSADNTGLKYEITPGDTSVAKDVMAHLARGDVSGSSIAFVVDEERWTETKDESGKWQALREILSVTLYDVGPVTFPAYEATSAGVRAAGDAAEAKRSFEAFRQAHPRADVKADDVKGKLAGYAARMRVRECEQQQ